MKTRALKSMSIFLVLVMSLSVLFVGCSKTEDVTNETQVEKKEETKQEATSAEETKEELVKLSWYYMTDPQKDQDVIEEEVNNITKEKINAEIDLKPIDGGSYKDKMRTTIAAGEEFDICFTAHWSNDFYGNVAKGAFVPLNDLLTEYAPKTYESIPAEFWPAVTINGNIYGVPNYQIVATQTGLIIQKPIAEKYNIDLDSINTLQDLTPIFEEIKNNEDPDTVVFPSRKKGIWGYLPTMYDMEEIAGDSPGWVDVSGDELKVINQYASDGFKEHVNLMREWFLAGYINKDAATLENYMPLIKTGKAAVMYSDMKPGSKPQRKVQFGGIEVEEKIMLQPFVQTNGLSATLQAISKTSKNPERAMAFIELMNTDKELYNLMCYGIEGQHYNKVDENRIELVENSGYYPNKAWVYGNQFNAYLLPGQDDNVWEQTIELNNSSKAAETLGFVFDQEPVKTEIAQCQSVVDEFIPGLVNGAVDPDKYLPQFIEKLETAGAAKVIAEKQNQLDKWLSSK